MNTHLRSVDLTVAEKYLLGLWRIKIKNKRTSISAFNLSL